MTGDVADELGSLELFVERCVENWPPSPYLDRASVSGFLEEFAYQSRRRDARGVELSIMATAVKMFTWPADMADDERRATVARLLTGSGVAVPAGEGVRFVEPDVQAYLAARRMVRRAPRGPRWWRPSTWHWLQPGAGWPDSGVMLFLVALWWRDARPLMERRLRRLPARGDREGNAALINELTSRNLVPGSDIREHIIDALRRDLDRHKSDATRWGEAVAQLLRLEPAMARAEMSAHIRSQDPAVTPEGKLVAHDMLARHDQVLAAAELEFLADHPTGEPRDRFDLAVGIRHRHTALGTQLMRRLADFDDMGELRADAAVEGGSVTQMCRLLEHVPALPDGRRLRLAAAALAADKAIAVPAVVRFAEAVRSHDTRLRAVELLWKHDKDSALRIVHPIAWPARGNGDSKMRLRAVRLIGTIDPTRRTAELTRFSEDSSAGEPERYAAAHDNIDNDRSTAAMIKFGDDEATSITYRGKAAAAIGKVERATGARMYILLSQSSKSADRVRLLEAARKLDPARATEELVALARDRREVPEDRLKAAGLAAPRLNTTQKIALYTNIADTTSGERALAAARHVGGFRQTDGQRLMARLADRKRESDEFRLAAAHAGGRFGRAIFAQLFRALVAIAEDSAEKAQSRFDAAVNVNRYDSKQGRRLLNMLADDPKTPKRIRTEARKRQRTRRG